MWINLLTTTFTSLLPIGREASQEARGPRGPLCTVYVSCAFFLTTGMVYC